ncbi:mucin-2 [Eupeodes corollae]|uniref:mucin-2 n=1 Tax=Eupeodes corollae TaxID=290404 RepID=UPI00248F9CC3|nr:mucin-2 [Eupeodes corollae]
MIHNIMSDRQPYWIILPILIWICSIGYGISQSQNAIGRHRNFPKTSFSCAGRPAGYYADIETGCQVYHMCDGLGRQFSYSCPNTTLFQQRMLICDHWYMVNCSKAEMDYAANLLIGQRDKPFVPDGENHLRTPRPDLLDRPYAPDYSGESFRNQFKQLPAVQNSISDFNERKNIDKTFTLNHPSPTPTRWKIPQPSREILPPAPPSPTLTTRKPPTVASPAPRPLTSTRNYNAATSTTPASIIVNRNLDTSDELLGTAHSTRYNTSGDNSAEDKHSKQSPTKPPAVKTPSRIYEPPFLYPIYNENDTVQLTEAVPLQSSTAAPFTIKVTTTTNTTTPRPATRPTTFAGKPFTVESTTLTATSSKITQSTDSALDYNIPASGSKTFPLPSPFTPPKTTASKNVAAPSRELLPPLSDIVLHDTATTQGPPIYFEWKIPSNGLEPPKFEAPIGVDGREEQDAPLSYTSDQVKLPTPTTAKTTTANTQQYANNPFLSNKTQRSIDSSTSRTPTSRSIKNFPPSPGTEENKISPTLPTEQDINQLRMDFSVPDYLFPLENIGRTGYEHSDTFNSFQLKIPQRRADVVTPSTDRWYGENPKCPQCHPSFVKPGTCEPCLRR